MNGLSERIRKRWERIRKFFRRLSLASQWRRVIRKSEGAYDKLMSVERSPLVKLTDREQEAFMTTRHLLLDIMDDTRLPVLPEDMR